VLLLLWRGRALLLLLLLLLLLWGHPVLPLLRHHMARLQVQQLLQQGTAAERQPSAPG
jgi:hypothetical protein